MIEIVKVILDLLKGAIDFTDFAKENKKAKIGVKLFSVYQQLNQILITGNGIISSLEAYVSRMEGHLKNNNDPYALTGGNWLNYKIVEQRINLARFGLAVKSLVHELNIVDGKSFRQLGPLLSGKVNALDSLLRMLGSNSIPILGPTTTELIELSKLEGKVREYDERMEQSLWDSKREVQRKYEEASIPLSSNWDESVYRRVKEYLDDRKPREILKEIEAILEQYKAAIEKNFSISEILIEVGKDGFEERYSGQYFW